MAESRGERYYICVIGQISSVCEGREKKKEIRSTGLANGESEKERRGAVVAVVGGVMSLECPF